MCQATIDNPGFVMIPRQSWRHPVYMLSDLDYADDIAMLPSGIGDAQKFHDRLVLAAADVGLHVNATKTKVIHGHLHCKLKTSTLTSMMILITQVHLLPPQRTTSRNYKVNWEV